MSLLNDVLRDLDRGNANRVEAQITPDIPTSQRKKNLWLPVVAGLAVAYWCLVEADLLGLMPEQEPVLAEPPAAVAFNNKWLAKAEAYKAEKERLVADATIEASAAASAELAVTPSDVAGPAPQMAAIERLMNRAQEALNAQTSEADQLAYALLQSVLTIDSTHAGAETGLSDIRSRHQTRIEVAVASGDRTALPGLIALGETFQLSPQALEPARLAHAKASEPPPARKLAPNPADRDALLAQKLLGTNWRRHEADSLHWIDTGKVIEQTALALAERYHQANSLLDLNNLHERLSARFAPTAELVLARVHWLSARVEPAVALLAQTRLDGAAEQVRLRLLGGWLQQMQRYGEAAEAYRPLVQSGLAIQTDWLGYAVALDAGGRPAEALSAYREAGRTAHSDGKINAFIQRRIGELTTSLIGR